MSRLSLTNIYAYVTRVIFELIKGEMAYVRDLELMESVRRLS